MQLSTQKRETGIPLEHVQATVRVLEHMASDAQALTRRPESYHRASEFEQGVAAGLIVALELLRELAGGKPPLKM
ncbi:MAG: hypothetical protein NDJ89_09640 [Oligoflexia bacterium]|nr:hypothetical protein [Oligoflexia bacterium]